MLSPIIDKITPRATIALANGMRNMAMGMRDVATNNTRLASTLKVHKINNKIENILWHYICINENISHRVPLLPYTTNKRHQEMCAVDIGLYAKRPINKQ